MISALAGMKLCGSGAGAEVYARCRRITVLCRPARVATGHKSSNTARHVSPSPAITHTPEASLLSPQVIVPTLLVPLIGYRLYRRFRANFGQQPIQPTRKVVRLVILSIVTALLLSVAMRSAPALEAAAGGLLAGV